MGNDGIVLRPLVAGDDARWLEVYDDPDEQRFGVPAGIPVPTTLAEIEERRERAAEAWQAGEPGSLAIVAEDDPGRWLGLIAWRLDLPPSFRCADIGYAVHPDARGRGVARRAIRALVAWLVDDGGAGMLRVQLDHSVENVASCRVALAGGLTIEGVRPSYLPLRDPDAPGGVRRHDVCLHGYVAPVGR